MKIKLSEIDSQQIKWSKSKYHLSKILRKILNKQIIHQIKSEEELIQQK